MGVNEAIKSEFTFRAKNLTGQRFGRLLVSRYYGFEPLRSGPLHYWLCTCDCGAEVVCTSNNLGRGTRSCGCLKREETRARQTKHGMTGSPEYIAWVNMRGRCYDPNDKAYDRYGGRGITVCKRWRDSFENFYTDMGPRPSPRHSIDRKRNNGSYSPANCRWATPEQQASNTRRNVVVEIDGERMILAEAIRRSGLPPKIVDNRLRRGWDLTRALTTPLWRAGKARSPIRSRPDGCWVTVDGEPMLLRAACRRLGLPYKPVHARIRHGWTPERALSEPIKTPG